MSDIQAQVHRYLTPAANAFWNWSEDGDAVVWVENNQTIAFRTELALILRRHLSKGLPPFGSVLLLVAACRDSWGSPNVLRWNKATLKELMGETLLGETFQQLDNMRGIPQELRTSIAAKAELSAMVFETVGNRTSSEVAIAVVEALSHGVAAEMVRRDAAYFESPSFLDVLQPLWEGLQRFDVEAFKLRLETGLEELPTPAEVEEPLATRIRKLFDQLQNEEEFSGLVRMARNLLAMVSLPKPLIQPDEIPVGGVSDISNRGTLDRLLLSELAQDDEVLMLRVAMNEAMYLRRETPPRNPPRTRLLLLDMGLRMWGIPRVMATSVAMSFAAMNDGPTDLRVLRSERGQLRATDLSTRQGLVDHLKVLDPQIHPGEALGDLTRWMQTEEHETDVILVTCHEVLADREFQEWLKEFGEAIEFLATVSRAGEFQLLQRTVHGTRLLRKAHLDLDQLLTSPKSPKSTLPLVDPSVPTNLPAILRLQQFPLRLSHHLTAQQSWRVRYHGALSITNDRRLMHWDDPRLGAKQLTDQLSSRRLLWCQTHAEKGCTRFVVGKAGKPELQLGLVDLEQGHCVLRPVDTSAAHVHAVCSHAGVLFVIHRHEIDVCDLFTGERITTTSTPRRFRWSHGRFFRRGDLWKALSFDGVKPRFQSVKSQRGTLSNLIDVEGIQGPVGLGTMDRNEFGLFILDDFFPLKEIHSSFRLEQVARDGTRVLARNGVYLADRVIIDVLNKRSIPIRTESHEALDSELWHLVRPRHYRNRIRAIAGQGGGLLLQTSWEIFSLNFDESQSRIQIQLVPSKRDFAIPMREFRPVPAPPGVGYKLQMAEWNDGSRAFLDSRGLLHLKSSDPRISEISFVLYDEQVAGWCANGEKWGEEYYTGVKPAMDPKTAEGLFGKSSQAIAYRTPLKILNEFVARLR